ncbi:unnamed protein product [Adineta ricciae]|uniref:Cytochrome P450 n=1 Tax=Adineta ricciae TaxID=249248 RepID=A0A815ZEM0_ADIRI|nr:unnamed protein product [Adineta ricciae]
MWLNLLTFAILLYFIYRLLKFWIFDPKRIHDDLASQGIPGQHIPIFGEILSIRRAAERGDPLSHLRLLREKYGPYYRSSFGPIARLSTSDPGLIQGILKSNARCYHKSNLMQMILGTLLGHDSLLMAEDNVHSQHRRLIAPVFQHQNINSMISLMIEKTSNYIEKWQNSLRETAPKDFIVDMHAEMARLTLDIVTGCVFGDGLMGDNHARKIIYDNVTTTLADVEKRIHNMIAIIPIVNRLPLPSKQRIDKSKRDVRIVIQQIIDDRKQGLTKSSCKGPDLLDLILAARGDDKISKFTDKEIYEETLTFIIAGHETTSNLMVWTFYNLANNPDVYQRLESEIDSVLDENDEISISTLSLLTYTEAVLKESLRLHQPVPTLVRKVVEDNTLTASDGKKIHLKKGTDILVDIYGLHHSELYWSEPMKFDPSRFTGRHADTLLPFSAGPRSCIGQNFAMLEAKVMLAMLVKHFHFELVPGQKHVPEIVITMRPKYGMWTKLSLR